MARRKLAGSTIHDVKVGIVAILVLCVMAASTATLLQSHRRRYRPVVIEPYRSYRAKREIERQMDGRELGR